MKTAILSTILFLGLASFSFSQTKKNAKEIQKEIKVEVENGKTVMTIITSDGDKVTEEVFEGAAAEAKLKEFQEKVEFEEESQTVKLEDHDGQKKLTVTTTKDGKSTEEVFIGAEAEKKMKEMGLQPSTMKEVEKEQLINQ